MERGAGYWLWKPFIIAEALSAMQASEVLIFSDAGIEIVADLSPLLTIAAAQQEPVLILGYGCCSAWTKRDCFALLNADDARYHRAPMVDASFLLVRRTDYAMALIHEWLTYCKNDAILTDRPNTCGLPNLKDFVDHRHDQSVLSILAARERIELFRRPSQFGNHLKLSDYRVPGEWIREPYSPMPQANSPYGELLYHHRGKPRVIVRRDVTRSIEETFARWWSEEFLSWLASAFDAVVSVERYQGVVGGEFCLKCTPACGPVFYLCGAFFDVRPPTNIAFTWNYRRQPSATNPRRLDMRVFVSCCARADNTEIAVTHDMLPNEKARDRHRALWKSWLAHLATHGKPADTR
jgi:uncharacterized protein YndB with AHSA1/START domain